MTSFPLLVPRQKTCQALSLNNSPLRQTKVDLRIISNIQALPQAGDHGVVSDDGALQVDIFDVGEIADDGIPDDGPFDAGIIADGHMRADDGILDIAVLAKKIKTLKIIAINNGNKQNN